jgi:hypothetical protein
MICPALCVGIMVPDNIVLEVPRVGHNLQQGRIEHALIAR